MSTADSHCSALELRFLNVRGGVLFLRLLRESMKKNNKRMTEKETMQETTLQPCSEILIMLCYYGFAVIAVAELRNDKHHRVVIRPVNLEDAQVFCCCP